MRRAISAELRKLFTVRSTYGLAAFSLFLTILLSFYVKGLRATGPINDPLMLQQIPMIVTSIVSVVIAIVATLLVGFDYRHNTILYAMATVRNRVHVLFAKIIAITIFVTIFSLCITVLSVVLTLLGLHLHHVSYVHQDFSAYSVVWRTVFYSWGYAMFALMIGFIARNMVASIVAIFLIPTTVEQLIGLLIGKNVAYLPFQALIAVLGDNDRLSHESGMIVTVFYVLVSGLITWYLLIRRDTN